MLHKSTHEKDNKILKILFVYNGIFVLGASLLGPLYAVFVETINPSVLVVSWSWAAFLISAIFFLFVMARVGDRVQKKKYLLLAGYIVRAIAWFLFLFVQSVPALILVQILIGLGEALGTPAFNAIFAAHLNHGKQIADYANYKIVSMAVVTLGTIVGGLVVNSFGFQPLFLAMSGLAILSSIGVLAQSRDIM